MQFAGNHTHCHPIMEKYSKQPKLLSPLLHAILTVIHIQLFPANYTQVSVNTYTNQDTR